MLFTDYKHIKKSETIASNQHDCYVPPYLLGIRVNLVVAVVVLIKLFLYYLTSLFLLSSDNVIDLCTCFGQTNESAKPKAV